MKYFKLFATVLFGCFAIQAAYCDEILVTIKRGNLESSYMIDDQTLVRDLATKYLRENHFDPNPKHLRMESHLGSTYPLDKTLKDAGVQDGTDMKIKFWSRVEDVGAHIIKHLNYPEHGLMF